VAMLNVNTMATSFRKAPSDARDGAAHQNSHEHERRSRGIGRNRRDQWPAKHSQEKQHRDNDVAQTRTRAGCHPGSTLDVTRNCGSARERAKHRPDGVSHQSAAGAWKLPISQEPAPFANTDKRPTLSNRSTKRKTKISSPESDFCGRSQIELQKSTGRMWQRKEASRPMTEPERNARESDRHNSQENGAAEPSSHENGNQYKTRGKQDLRIGNPSKPDIRSGISHDHLCVAQADKRDKQANAGSCSMLEAIRYSVDDLLANVAQRKQ
jgi:hypothetical protein